MEVPWSNWPLGDSAWAQQDRISGPGSVANYLRIEFFFLDGYTLVIPVAKVHTNDSEDLISKINKLGVLAYRADNPAS